MKNPKEITTLLTRPTKMPVIEAASIAFWKNLPKLTGFSLSVSAFAVKENIVQIMRNERESKKLLPQHLLKKVKKSPRFWPKFEKSFQRQIAEIKKLLVAIKKEDPSDKKRVASLIKKFHRIYQQAWVGGLVVGWLPRIIENLNQQNKEFTNIAKKALRLRQETEKLLGWGMEFYESVFKKMVKETNLPLELSDNLKFKETIAYFEKGILPPQSVLKERFKKGWVSLNNRFYLLKGRPIKKFFQEKGYKIVEAGVKRGIKIIKGQTAYPGQAKGRVKIMMHYREIDKFRAGQVLVTSMTTPQYLPAMKRAVAIVTDEGGITCHAAIISRELGIPCIIGTKIATKVLKDSDLVEVDAQRGVVEIIK